MNTFLKRNRGIKLFTAVWIFAMTVLAAVLLLITPPEDNHDPEIIFIPARNMSIVYHIILNKDTEIIFIPEGSEEEVSESLSKCDDSSHKLSKVWL